jgi:hypothetical protein
MSIVFGCVTNVQMFSEQKVRIVVMIKHEIKVGVASPADVSPNTPKADEANL